MSESIDLYFCDHGAYPQPVVTSDDPFGVVCEKALHVLTTPIAYGNSTMFRDPFGALRVQVATLDPALSTGDPFRPPSPQFNSNQSLLYFHYPSVAGLLEESSLSTLAYAAVSVGPDLKDSFIMYYPFPPHLPSRAGMFGIQSASDTVYDPTNGAISSGDLAVFGGNLPAPRFVGGEH